MPINNLEQKFKIERVSFYANTKETLQKYPIYLSAHNQIEVPKTKSNIYVLPKSQ
jgi:hypothetical protein